MNNKGIYINQVLDKIDNFNKAIVGYPNVDPMDHSEKEIKIMLDGYFKICVGKLIKELEEML